VKSGIEYMAELYDQYREKITWDKLTERTPMFVIESEATIFAPLLLAALLECKEHPREANALLAG
jgi:deoxyhypusine synthase